MKTLGETFFEGMRKIGSTIATVKTDGDHGAERDLGGTPTVHLLERLYANRWVIN